MYKRQLYARSAFADEQRALDFATSATLEQIEADPAYGLYASVLDKTIELMNRQREASSEYACLLYTSMSCTTGKAP